MQTGRRVERKMTVKISFKREKNLFLSSRLLELSEGKKTRNGQKTEISAKKRKSVFGTEGARLH